MIDCVWQGLAPHLQHARGVRQRGAEAWDVRRSTFGCVRQVLKPHLKHAQGVKECGVEVWKRAHHLSPNFPHPSLLVPNGCPHFPTLQHMQEVPQPHDVIVHLTWPQNFPANHSCWDKEYRNNNERKCKYLGLEFYVTNVSAEKLLL